MRAIIFAAALLAASPALAQQADPTQALIAEWQAMKLAQTHSEEALSRLVSSYESRLATAMEWLNAAQAEKAAKELR